MATRLRRSIAQHQIGQHIGQHGFGNRHGAGADGWIVAPLDDDRGRVQIDIHGLLLSLD
ncbi:MAG: hypothetical protein R2839_11160 [Thermomicrobiales bacterium]